MTVLVRAWRERQPSTLSKPRRRRERIFSPFDMSPGRLAGPARSRFGAAASIVARSHRISAIAHMLGSISSWPARPRPGRIDDSFPTDQDLAS
ncbi:hypothetical protein [Burkholderia gladioli]|uniref:hypothetical protein n=1 Tax=Burkholderia gladioli TaxID=28095 RepID=UPI001560F064|nr:hypothetical protein [Burkholderia gladioli]MBA1363513.1 hypothetical protein [Burkholderia gladioli]NRF85657.1 hypothetical protein [Burkholderia gladioli]